METGNHGEMLLSFGGTVTVTLSLFMIKTIPAFRPGRLSISTTLQYTVQQSRL